MAKSPYKLLPGSEWGTFGKRHALYKGPDHLLSVFSNGYVERYKRFYYRDIYALVFTITPAGRIWNLVFVLLAAGFLAAAYYGERFYAIHSAAFFLGLLINMALGPTCVCRITTAAQTEELPSLRRKRKTRKVILRLKPLIEADQQSYAADFAGDRKTAEANSGDAERPV